MKVNRQNLQKALETVKPGLSNKEMIEQTTSFCFLDGRVVTYNDEISISSPIDDLDITGAINAQELHSFISKVKQEEVSLEVDGNEVLLKAGRSKAGLTLQAEIVLPVEEIGKINKWKDLPKEFTKGLSFAMASCSRDMTRPVLTCVHVNNDIIEGADSHRITRFQLDKKVPIDAFLLPANICGTVIKMHPTQIASGEGWVHFKTKDKSILSCRIFEEAYVNTEALMDMQGATITFPKEISALLEKAQIFSKRDQTLDESVKIILGGKRLIIKSESASGWFEEIAKTNYNGDQIEFSITPYLLADIMKETNTGQIGDNRLLFEGENWKYITMLRS